MNKPIENFSDELLSAYLDGELTADEQALVEEVLARSEEHRRMLDDLRALRDSLQSLPRAELPEDFGDRVVRQAERQMLTGPTDAAGLPVADAPTRAPDDRGIWRGAVWAVAAVAAALLLMLFVPDGGKQQQQQRQLSRGTGERPSASETSVSEDSSQPAVDARPAPAGDLAAETDVPEVRRAARDNAAADDSGSKHDRAEMYEKKRRDLPVGPETAKGAGKEAVDRKLPDSQDRPDVRIGLPAPAAPFAPQQHTAAAPAAPTAGLNRQEAAERPSRAAGDATAPARNHWSQLIAAATDQTNAQLVVQLSVTPEAFVARKFDESLARNRIEFAREAVAFSARSFATPKVAADDAVLRPGVADRLQGGRSAASEEAGAAVSGVELVCVEATVDQVQATVADFQRQANQLVSLSIDAAPQIAAHRLRESLQPSEGIFQQQQPPKPVEAAATARSVRGGAALSVELDAADKTVAGDRDPGRATRGFAPEPLAEKAQREGFADTVGRIAPAEVPAMVAPRTEPRVAKLKRMLSQLATGQTEKQQATLRRADGVGADALAVDLDQESSDQRLAGRARRLVIPDDSQPAAERKALKDGAAAVADAVARPRPQQPTFAAQQARPDGTTDSFRAGEASGLAAAALPDQRVRVLFVLRSSGQLLLNAREVPAASALEAEVVPAEPANR